MSGGWEQTVYAAFHRDAALHARVTAAIQRDRDDIAALLTEIASYILSPPSSTTPADYGSTLAHAKKRKLDADTAPSAIPPNGSSSSTSAAPPLTDPIVAFDCPDVSVQVPARKKLRLQLVRDARDARRQEIRLLHPQTGATECALRGAAVDQVFCLPVPEKQQRAWNFCVFPRRGRGADGGGGGGEEGGEQIVFTMPETKPIGVRVAEGEDEAATGGEAEAQTYVTVTAPALDRVLRAYGKRVVRPTEAEFASSLVQAHRKGEKAYHVKAHRGTKEGYLFFLSNGVVFGFKKPLSFFPFANIQSISYTSVLQRTFNLVIAAMEEGETEVKETEFSMLDQADFAGIDAYVKRHGLNDASMAAERRAKAYNVNKESRKEVANGDAPAAVDGEDEQTELQKAEQQLQDEEDELEEDYEASGGDSDGEGEDSDEEGEEYNEGYEEEYDEEEGEGEEQE